MYFVPAWTLESATVMSDAPRLRTVFALALPAELKRRRLIRLYTSRRAGTQFVA
jgi:hypothetical protein